MMNGKENPKELKPRRVRNRRSLFLVWKGTFYVGKNEINLSSFFAF